MFFLWKMGHVSQMCRTKARKPVLDNRTHLVNDTQQPSSMTDVTELYSVYEVTTRRNPSEPPITVEMEIGGASLEMEVNWAAYDIGRYVQAFQAETVTGVRR